jgi:hypothetical protein
MTKETPTIKNALVARLIAAKLAAIKAGGGDGDSRRMCMGQISNATEE